MPAVRVLGCVARGHDVLSGRSEDPHEHLLVIILDGDEERTARFFRRGEGLLSWVLSHGKLGKAAHPDREDSEHGKSDTIVPMKALEVALYPQHGSFLPSGMCQSRWDM